MNVPCPVAGYEDRRWCYTITADCVDESGSHIPSIVVEDVAGHYPMKGQGYHATPWTWGKNYDDAQRVCDAFNKERLGISPKEAAEIVGSSMRKSLRTASPFRLK
jgi:hypothetical protein